MSVSFKSLSPWFHYQYCSWNFMLPYVCRKGYIHIEHHEGIGIQVYICTWKGAHWHIISQTGYVMFGTLVMAQACFVILGKPGTTTPYQVRGRSRPTSCTVHTIFFAMKVWWLPFLALFSNRPQLPGMCRTTCLLHQRTNL